MSRNLRDFLDITAALEEYGVRLACVAHPIDTGTAAGRVFVNLMAVFGQLEREQSAERVADTFQAIRKRGGYIGGCTPFGYLVQDKHLVPDPERRDVVRKMFECFLRTASEKAVAAMVEECGATRRDGRPWNLSYIGRILRNRVYCGEVMFRGEPGPPRGRARTRDPRPTRSRGSCAAAIAAARCRPLRHTAGTTIPRSTATSPAATTPSGRIRSAP